MTFALLAICRAEESEGFLVEIASLSCLFNSGCWTPFLKESGWALPTIHETCDVLQSTEMGT